MNAPSCVRRIVHCSAGELREGEGYVRSVRLDHMLERGGALQCAEGEEEASEFVIPEGTTDIWCVDDRLYAHNKVTHRLTLLPLGRTYVTGEELKRVINRIGLKGTDARVAICTDAIYCMENYSAAATIYGNVTSCNLALYRERLFGVKNGRMYFSEPTKFMNWSVYSEQGSGYCDLFAEGGREVDLFVVRDRLFILRESGITRLTGYADLFNYRLNDMPYSMGKALSWAAVIGDNAYFFTESGLCRFDGTSAVRAQGAADELIDLTKPIRAETAWGRALAASVTLTDGTSALYLYEPAFRRGRLVRRAHEAFSAANDLVILRGGKVYRLKGRALPAGGSCSLTVEFAFGSLGNGEKRLEALCLDGTGSVSVEAFGQDGVRRTCKGAAGEWLDFAAGVRGEHVTVRISSSDEEFSVREITLRVRREDRI